MFLSLYGDGPLWPQEHVMEAVYLMTVKMSEMVHIMVDRVEL